ncbi:hypothetical protein [Escherichia coli]|uniref:hypothetical protein n=1 Tax=Escherichia coli TaxID=562 RepID=UPI003B43127B
MSGGGHGIDITGDSATVDNKGGMTVADADSIGVRIDGDKAVVKQPTVTMPSATAAPARRLTATKPP